MQAWTTLKEMAKSSGVSRAALSRLLQKIRQMPLEPIAAPNSGTSNALTSVNALSEKEHYLLGLIDAIVRMDQTPFPFLCAATMVEYISNLCGHGNSYDNFICTYFPPAYKEFQYKNGKKDLPTQMLYLLRNGLVHNFSLVPRAAPPMRKTRCTASGCKFSALVSESDLRITGSPHCPNHGSMSADQPSEGRRRSILITHRSAGEGPHLKLVSKLDDGTEVDSALFVLEELCNDLSGVVRAIFKKAQGEGKFANKIIKNWEACPPIAWLGRPTG